MIRLLVISNYNKPNSSRPEAEMFLNLAKNPEFDITVMTNDGSDYAIKLKAAGIKIIDFHPVKKNQKSDITFIRSEIIKGSYHIVHLFSTLSIISGIKACRKLKIKLVIYRGYTGNVHWYDPSAYFKVLHPRVDYIMCNSQSVKDQIDRQFLFNKSKTVVITKGHDTAWYSKVIAADLDEFGVEKDDFVATINANHRKMKGMKYLLKAISMLPSEIKLKLIVFGGNNESISKYSKMITKNHEKVIYTGFRTDNLNITSASNVYVSASIKGESFQKSVAEAMHLGVCPIITDIPGNIGMVKDKECGLVIPSNNPVAIKDALLYLYSNREKCKEFGLAAQKHISRNFSNEQTTQNLAVFYKKILPTNTFDSKKER